MGIQQAGIDSFVYTETVRLWCYCIEFRLSANTFIADNLSHTDISTPSSKPPSPSVRGTYHPPKRASLVTSQTSSHVRLSPPLPLSSILAQNMYLNSQNSNYRGGDDGLHPIPHNPLGAQLPPLAGWRGTYNGVQPPPRCGGRERYGEHFRDEGVG